MNFIYQNNVKTFPQLICLFLGIHFFILLIMFVNISFNDHHMKKMKMMEEMMKNSEKLETKSKGNSEKLKKEDQFQY